MRTQAALLETLNSLNHHQRLATAAATAQQLHAEHPAQLLALIDALIDADSHYERYLGAIMAQTIKDLGRLRRLSLDPMISISAMASAALIKDDPDASYMASWYMGLNAHQRSVARGHILRRKRGDIARALIEPLQARGLEQEVASLLSLCDVPTLERVLPGQDIHKVQWRHISQAHLPLAARQLTEALEQASSEGARQWRWSIFSPAAQLLALKAPDELLALLKAHPTQQPINSIIPAISTLARQRPESFASWLLNEATTSWRSALLHKLPKRTITKLPQEAIVKLTRMLKLDHTALSRLLGALSPSVRGQAFTQAFAQEDISQVIWSPQLLELLHWPVRQAQAARICALRQIKSNHIQLVAYTSFLSTADAAPILTPLMRGSTADDRALGCAATIDNHRMARQPFSVLLEQLVPKLKNEQDPVRMAALQAIAKTPGWMFEAQGIEHLQAIITHTLEARDTSWSTRSACTQIAHKLLLAHAHQPKSAQFIGALDILRALAGQSAIQFPYNLCQGLRRDATAPLAHAVLDWLEASAARNRYDEIISFAQRLEDRAWGLERLQALLESAIWATPSHIGALSLWLAAPHTRDERVTRAIDKERSIVIYYPVWEHLHTHRQDLLDPFIQGLALGGRFAPTKTGWLLPACDGFERWLPRQQTTFAQVLRRVIADTKQKVEARVSAVSPLAAMPIHAPDDLTDLTTSAEVPICEAALGALIYTQQPALAIPLLLEHLDSDRARVAMYALPRVAQFISDAQLLEHMSALLERDYLKVTVLKETLRLIGAVHSEQAAALIAAVWRRPKLHRDARIAALHAARQQLDYAQSWVMLDEATQDPEQYVALALLEAQPLGMAHQHRERYSLKLLKLADHPEPRVRQGFFAAMCRPSYGVGDWLELARGPVAHAAQAAMLDLNATYWRQAQACLLALLQRTPHDPAPIQATLQRLRTHSEQELTTPEPTLDRDLPYTQRLHALINALHTQHYMHRARLTSALHALADALPATPQYQVQALKLRLSAHRPDDLPITKHIIAALHTDAPPSIHRALHDACINALLAPSAMQQATDQLPVLDALIDAPSPDARHVALLALTHIGQTQQWSAPWRARLLRLRLDPDESIRIDACGVFIFTE